MEAKPREEDVLFGRIAVRKQFLSEEDAERALKKQKALEEKGEKKRLGEILVEYRLLTPDQVDAILAIQKKSILECPKCSAAFNVEGMKPGKKFRCKVCKTSLRVPDVEKAEGGSEEGVAEESPASETPSEVPPPEEIKPTWIFGKVAVAMGMISAEQAREAASMQEELAAEGVTLDFGEVLVQMNVIDEGDVQKVLDAQWGTPIDPEDVLFGSVAVENGFLDPDTLKECLELQRELASELSDAGDVPRIAEILLMEEMVDPAVVEAVLKVQERVKAREWVASPSVEAPPPSKGKKLKVRSPEDALFFKVGVRNRFLTAGHVNAILEKQRADPRPWSVGEIAVELGFLEALDVAAIEEVVARKEGVRDRRRKHKTTAEIEILKEDAEFGSTALKNGFVDEAQLRKAEKAFKALQYLQFPRSVGEILFDQGLLSADQIKAILDILRLKGDVLPAYQLEEILLSDKEERVAQALINEGARVAQSQVTECTKIRKELESYGIQRSLGEIMLVKGYLSRDGLKKRPLPPRGRAARPSSRPSSGRLEKAGAPRNTFLLLAGGAIVLAFLILILGLALKGGGEKEKEKTAPKKTETVSIEDKTPKPAATPVDKVSGGEEEAVRRGMVKWKHRWIAKEKFKEESRRKFYEALREAVAGQ
jgi:hypothetical protein